MIHPGILRAILHDIIKSQDEFIRIAEAELEELRREAGLKDFCDEDVEPFSRSSRPPVLR